LPALGLLDQVQIGDTGPAESTRRGNLQRVGLLLLGSRDNDIKDFLNISYTTLYLAKNLLANWLSSSAGFESGKGNK
jgi:hypothetical protein